MSLIKPPTRGKQFARLTRESVARITRRRTPIRTYQ
jgi:hypothetical protein